MAARLFSPLPCPVRYNTLKGRSPCRRVETAGAAPVTASHVRRVLGRDRVRGRESIGRSNSAVFKIALAVYPAPTHGNIPSPISGQRLTRTTRPRRPSPKAPQQENAPEDDLWRFTAIWRP